MFSSVASNVLGLLGYPRLIKKLPGAFSVGVRRVRIPGSVHCQVLYPIEVPVEGIEQVRYWRTEAVDGLASYSGLPRQLFNVLMHSHPCPSGRPPLDGAWPIIIFSHGLGGCADMYLQVRSCTTAQSQCCLLHAHSLLLAQFCMFLASFGYVVVAMEHEDGSGCHAETVGGKIVRYDSPPAGFVYTRENLIGFRKRFLSHRVREVDAVLAYLLAADSTGELTDILQTTDRSGVILVGHSFGAASSVLAAQDHSPFGFLMRSQIRAIVILDPWAFSLPEVVLKRGVRQPMLCVLSETWTVNSELSAVRTLLEHSAGLKSTLSVPGTCHQSVSDTSTWAPEVLTRKMGALGATEVPGTARLATAEACHAFLQWELMPRAGSCVRATQVAAVWSGESSKDTLRPFRFEGG